MLSGDFFQLPPVNRGGKTEQSDMIVYSNAWKAMKPAICYLTEQHRQDDGKFTEILNSIRKDGLKESHFKEIEKRMHASIAHVEPTKLYTHNADVDMINMEALNKLTEKEYGYEMSGRGGDVLVDILKKSCLAHPKLILKKGAQVMFVKNNFDRGYVNGTRGVVVNFLGDGTPVVRTTTGDEIEVIEAGS